MYADDVVLISRSETGLQNCLDRLATYCNRWNLIINTKKTKVVIINKTGKRKNMHFFIDQELIECVPSYKYLGILMSAAGTFTLAMEDLKDRGLRALYQLKTTILNNNINPDLALKLFDQLIRPIVTYGCEIWGAFLNKLNKRTEEGSGCTQCYDKDIFETLHLKFMKFVLGVHSKASNNGTRGELGRYPLAIYIHTQTIKYASRLMTLTDSSSLLYDAYQANINMCNADLTCWLTNTKVPFVFK
jgi:hypothetical protein